MGLYGSLKHENKNKCSGEAIERIMCSVRLSQDAIVTFTFEPWEIPIN